MGQRGLTVDATAATTAGTAEESKKSWLSDGREETKWSWDSEG